MKHAGTGDTCEKGKVMVFLRMSFRDLCIVTVSLPLISLLICFVTAYVFQYDDIHETHCRVYNIIPSISAVTGVSPQRYLWRISVALHMGPRIAIALVSKTFYDNLVINYKGQESSRAKILNTLCHWLNCIEIAALCGVTYISNRENYRK
ncbi:LOW QUALITY PROTEIN: post-GPI attachment to proteins factor 2-like [Ctenocephalides felis]|uniref:LOW QUALITY PROTEIN: post-GPI attachment to proteins factor 2-like n=1 Tax=Ctenocephalides felis TaxID=7515 RepID=UPI000E6E5886|nr:LOW QUALITY PROTEIN: post-GPI attachment to proteins factor 2-like [Ctenocephalides felis]